MCWPVGPRMCASRLQCASTNFVLACPYAADWCYVLTEERTEKPTSALCMRMFVCILTCLHTQYLYILPRLASPCITSFGLIILCPLMRTMLETSSSCRTPMIRTSHSMMFFNFGRKELFNMPRNPSYWHY